MDIEAEDLKNELQEARSYVKDAIDSLGDYHEIFLDGADLYDIHEALQALIDVQKKCKEHGVELR